MKLTTTKIVAVAVVSLAAAGVSFAHPGGFGYGMGPGMGYGMGPGMGYGMGPGMGYSMGPGMGHGMGGWMAGADAGTFVTGRLASLKAELKITSDQEKAWAAFESQTQQQIASMQALHNQMQTQMHGPQSGATGADFAALREAMFKLRQANHEARTAVLKDLYAVLTPEQKTIADQHRIGGWGPGMARGRPFN